MSNHGHVIHFEGLDFDPDGSLGCSELSVNDTSDTNLPTSSVVE